MKILNITHRDTDGAGSSAILQNHFKNNVVVYPMSYYDIDERLPKIDFDSYDAVFLTDISPTKYDFTIHKNAILLDHHETALNFKNKRNVIDISVCASVVVKRWVEEKLKTDLCHLSEFVRLVNDYDMWIHNDPKSWALNELYYRYDFDGFLKRFKTGDVRFNKDEKDFIMERKSHQTQLFNSLDYLVLENINGVFFCADEMINDLCHLNLTKNKYDFAFCYNAKKKTLSIRTSRDDIPTGAILKAAGLGGGHDKASATYKVEMNNINDLLKTISEDFENWLKRKNVINK